MGRAVRHTPTPRMNMDRTSLVNKRDARAAAAAALGLEIVDAQPLAGGNVAELVERLRLSDGRSVVFKAATRWKRMLRRLGPSLAMAAGTLLAFPSSALGNVALTQISSDQFTNTTTVDGVAIYLRERALESARAWGVIRSRQTYETTGFALSSDRATTGLLGGGQAVADQIPGVRIDIWFGQPGRYRLGSVSKLVFLKEACQVTPYRGVRDSQPAGNLMIREPYG